MQLGVTSINKEDEVDSLLDYIMRLDNTNTEIRSKYFECLSNFNQFIEYSKQHPFELLPGFVMIQRMMFYLKNSDYLKIYTMDTAACNGTNNYNRSHPNPKELDDYGNDDGIIVLNSLRLNFGLEKSRKIYHKLYNYVSELKTKIDIHTYVSSKLINRYLFTLNIETDINEFCNRCTEENFFFLFSIIIFIKKYENGYDEKDIRKNINTQNATFSVGKKGFIYLFWIAELHKKSVLPLPNQV